MQTQEGMLELFLHKKSMRNDILHLAMVPMTGLGLGSKQSRGYRGDEWFAYRIQLFKNYTLKSLLNQTNKNFVIWMSFRPEEKTNPLCIEFEKYMQTCGQPFIFTYGGLCFWDDKFPNDNLLERLKLTLPVLKEKFNNTKFIYETLQPSDDCYSDETINNIQRIEPQKNTAITHQKGFMFNERTMRVAEWCPPTNPPFYTIMYPSDVFFDAEKHFNYMRGFKSHEDITKIFNCIRMPDFNYCVLVHQKNISTNWWHPFRGKIFNWAEGWVILKRFGIEIHKDLAEQEKIEKRDILNYKVGQILIKLKLYKPVKYVKNAIQRRAYLKNRQR